MSQEANRTIFVEKPLKSVCRMNLKSLSENTDPDQSLRYIDISSVSYPDGVTSRDNIPFSSAPSRARRVVVKDEIIISTVRTYLRAVAMIGEADHGAIASTGFAVCRANEEIDPRFLYYSMMAEPFIEQVIVKSTGISYPAINSSTLGGIKITVPNRETQRAVAHFLDRETQRIDDLTQEKSRFIGLLREKRVAEMSRAITQGLAKDVPMKASGQDWLGNVPTHWEIKKAKYLFDNMSRPVERDDEIITAFRDGQVCLRSRRRNEGYTFAEKEVGYQRIHEGDLVIHTMDAFAGAIGVSEDTGKATGEYAVCTPKTNAANPHFFAMVLRCMARRNYIYILCPSVRERAPRFRFFRFAPVPLPVPPRAEQDRIVAAIERETARIDGLISETERSIALLKEKRSALITAAVTGKIDVRSAT